MECPELVGEAVVLRAWRTEEAAWYVHARDADVFRWTREQPDLTPEAGAAAIAYFGGEPRLYPFAIVERASGDLAGNLPVTVEGDPASIAYWLAPGSRGRGLVTDALAVVLRWLADLGVHTAELEVHPDNHASRRAAERAGFRHSGTRRSDTSLAADGIVVVYERPPPG